MQKAMLGDAGPYLARGGELSLRHPHVVGDVLVQETLGPHRNIQLVIILMVILIRPRLSC